MKDPRTNRGWQHLKPAIKSRKLRQYFEHHKTVKTDDRWKMSKDEFSVVDEDDPVEAGELEGAEARIVRIREIHEEISDGIEQCEG